MAGKLIVSGKSSLSGKLTSEKTLIGIGFNIPGNITFSSLVSGVNQSTFADCIDGNNNTQIGDTNSGNNNLMTVSIYDISPKLVWTNIRAFASSTSMTPPLTSGGRWTGVVVEGSNDTTNGSDGIWSTIGWDDASPTKDIAPVIDTWFDHKIANHTAFCAIRFRQTSLAQFVGIAQFELLAIT